MTKLAAFVAAIAAVAAFSTGAHAAKHMAGESAQGGGISSSGKGTLKDGGQYESNMRQSGMSGMSGMSGTGGGTTQSGMSGAEGEGPEKSKKAKTSKPAAKKDQKSAK